MPTPTAHDLLAELPDRTARMLQAPTHADACVRKALVWLKSRAARHGFAVDFEAPDTGDEATDARLAMRAEILREAVLKRALYELWSLAERDDVAKDKRDDADDLVEGLVGATYDGGAGRGSGASGDAGDLLRAPAASVAQPVRSSLSDVYRASVS